MARKSFKKGVKSVIDSIENDAKKPTPKKTTTKSAKVKPKANVKKVKPTLPKSMEFNLGSRFVVQDVDAGMTALKEALMQKENITITSDVVTELDVSYMQMIIAFNNTAQSQNLQVNWKLQFSDEIMKNIKNAGICEVLNAFIE